MSSVPKLGNNRYLATSKGVNRMLTQLNGILAADNITVNPTAIVMGATATVTIDLSLGNFINLTTNTGAAGNTITLTNIKAGMYYFKVTSGITSSTITINNSFPAAAQSLTTTSGKVDLLTYISDGTNLYNINLKNLVP
jgi:hypothetical protein